MNRLSSPSAFTLLELFVTLAVVVALSMLTVMAVGVVRRSGAEMRCLSNFRQFGIATQEYANDNGGKLPPSAFTNVETQQEVAYYLVPYLLNKKAARQGHANTVEVLKLECPDTDWVYGFNAYMSEATVMQFPKPSGQIWGIELMGGRWLDQGVLTYKTGDLIQRTPKPHEGKVNVLYLDGHVAAAYVSDLRWAQITGGTSGYKASHETRAVGQKSYDK